MKHSYWKIAVLLLVLFALSAWPDPASAQCAMCKASSEANLKAGGGDPKGLNAGILYMLMLPYMVVGGIGVWWWRNRKRNENNPDVDEMVDVEVYGQG